jgi:hypothetical protein
VGVPSAMAEPRHAEQRSPLRKPNWDCWTHFFLENVKNCPYVMENYDCYVIIMDTINEPG